MFVALIGAHGTGKTSVYSALQEVRPSWLYLPEPARHIAPIIGASFPPDFLEKYGISFLQAIQLSHFCVLDPSLNPSLKLKNSPLILDRSPLDYLAYYYYFRTPAEEKDEDLMLKLVGYYTNFIDLFIFFPTGVFSLPEDPLTGFELQKDIENYLLSFLECVFAPVYSLESTTVSSRRDEIIGLIEEKIA